MKKSQKIGNAYALLERVMGMTAGINDHNVTQARGHLRAAISSLRKSLKTASKRDQEALTQSETWWGDVVAGTAQGFHSQEAWAKSLAQVQAMLDAEENKLKELDQVQTQTTQTDVPDGSDDTLLNG